MHPTAVINCAAYVAGGRVDYCEDDKPTTIAANLLLPVRLADACCASGATLIHVSTGCLFNGDNGGKGYSETDEPHLSFRTQCGTYVGSKELAERVISSYGPAYICRIRLPFDEFDHHRNYLSKLQRYPKVVRATNSISHRGDFVKAVLDLYESRAPHGTYNVTNPGAVDSAWICERIKRFLGPREFEFWDNDEFLKSVARTPKSNCKLDVSKLLSTGVRMRCVEDAIIDSLKKWVAEPKASA